VPAVHSNLARCCGRRSGLIVEGPALRRARRRQTGRFTEFIVLAH